MIDLSTFKVSIVIPCFNQNELLDRCLKSIEKQTHKNIEVIIVDDGSYQEISLDRHYAIENITLIRVINSGLSSARNYGIKLITGSYVKFLDADDELLPECIEEQLSMMVGNKGNYVNVCGFIEKYENHDVTIIPAFSDPVDALFNINIAAIHSYLFPKSVFTNGFLFSIEDKVDGGHEDYDFVFRLALSGYGFSTLHKPLVIYNKSNLSMSTNLNNMKRTFSLVWIDVISKLINGGFDLFRLSSINIFCIVVKYFDLLSSASDQNLERLISLKSKLLVLFEGIVSSLSAREREKLTSHFSKQDGFHEFIIALESCSESTSPLRPQHPQRINDVDYFLYDFYSSLSSNLYDDSLLDIIDYVKYHKSFSVYGAGVLGRRLVFFLNKLGINPDFIIDKNPVNDVIYGIQCISPNYINTYNIEHVIIASKEFKYEILDEIKNKFTKIKSTLMAY